MPKTPSEKFQAVFRDAFLPKTPSKKQNAIFDAFFRSVFWHLPHNISFFRNAFWHLGRHGEGEVVFQASFLAKTRVKIDRKIFQASFLARKTAIFHVQKPDQTADITK
jgi:hypothetical protein